MSRSVEVTPEFGGRPCPILREVHACNTHACPEDCVMQSYGAWGSCDVDCGGGQQARHRDIGQNATYGGKQCGHRIDYQSCNTHSCTVDCKVQWGGWSACTRSCGGGQSSRTGTIVVLPKYGGKLCRSSLNQGTTCNRSPCPLHCESVAGSWGPCSKSCGTWGMPIVPGL